MSDAVTKLSQQESQRHVLSLPNLLTYGRLVAVPVTKVAKWKTTVQLIAIGFLIAGPAGDKIVPYVSEFGLFCLWIAAALTLYTGYDYCRAGIGHVMDDK
jgi:cardiolipin synthase